MSRRGWRRGRPRIWLPVLLALVWTLGLATTAMGAFPWTGTWSTSFGEMRLTETVDPDSGVRTIAGQYDYVIPGRIEGTATGDVLTGTWIESVPTNGTGVGPLVFTMSQNGLRFTGFWNNQGLQPTLPWNGTRVTVRPPPLSPAGPPTPGATRPPPGLAGCDIVTIRNRVVQVYIPAPTARFATACGVARQAARGRVPGWSCSAPQRRNGVEYVTCRQLVLPTVPARATVCAPVVHESRQYSVWKRRVLCRYARATTLRMLRRQDPYIYEFVQSGLVPRWGCLIFGRGAGERGSCYKQVEDRFVVYFPAKR